MKRLIITIAIITVLAIGSFVYADKGFILLGIPGTLNKAAVSSGNVTWQGAATTWQGEAVTF